MTLPVGPQQFATDLFLTNQLRVTEGSTTGADQTLEDLRMLELVRPTVTIQKGAVAAGSVGLLATVAGGNIQFAGASNPNGTFTVGGTTFGTGTTAPLFSTAQSNGIGALNIGPSNLPVEASDTVRYAIVAQNTDKGDAYNVQIQDQLQPGYVIPTTLAGLNLRVFSGDGTQLTLGTDYTVAYNNGSGQFTITLADNNSNNVNNASIPLDSRTGSLSRGSASNVNGSGTTQITNGSNTVVVLYDATLATTADPNTVTPNETITNTATVTQYSSSPGPVGPANPNLSTAFGTAPSDKATVTIELPQQSKILVGTSITTTNNNAATQAVIGELARFTITYTIPQGMTPGASVVDTLDSGLAFVDIVSASVSSGNLTFSGGGLPSSGSTPANTTITNSGRTLTFNLGTISNSDTTGTPETITITYDALVLNFSTNTQGHPLNNTAQFKWTGNTNTVQTIQAGQTSNAAGIRGGTVTNVTVVEPQVGVTKTVTVNGVTNPPGNPVGQQGDAIVYGFTLTPTAGRPTAFNATFSDPLPTDAFGSVIGTPVLGGFSVTNGPVFLADGVTQLTLADFQIVGAGTQVSPFAIQTVPGVTFTNQPVSFQVSGTISAAAITNSSVGNTATVFWQSLNAPTGAQQALTSADPTNSFERTGNTTGTDKGQTNNYSSPGTATFTVTPFVPTKLIVDTSEPSTPETGGTSANPRPVEVGEIVRYRAYVQIAQGTTPNLSLVDLLPTGISLLGNVQVATVGATGDLTTTIGPVVNFNVADPTLANLPSTLTWTTLIVGPPVGQTVTFNLGTLTNTDGNPDTGEFVVIEFNGLVQNVSTNVDGKQLDNSFSVSVNGTASGPASSVASVKVVEPKVTDTQTVQNITAGTVVGATTSGDAGDVVEYKITLTNTGNATAFNTLLSDAFPGQLNNPTITAVSGGGFTTADFTITGGTLQTTSATGIDLSSAAPNNSVTITVRGTLAQAVAPEQAIPNTANISYTSLPGLGTALGSQPGAGFGRTLRADTFAVYCPTENRIG